MFKFNLEAVSNFLGIVILKNTISDYILALVLFLVLFFGFKLFRFVLLKKLKKIVSLTSNSFDDYIIVVIEKISSLTYYVLSLYFPLKTLISNETVERVLFTIFVVVLFVQIIFSVLMIVDYGLDVFYSSKKAGKKYSKTASYGIKLFISILVWIIGFLMILSNLGFDVTSLIASLGIGGVAVALALQNILGDVISSFSIYFDRPFDIGDFIVVGSSEGTVEKIGMKTTRLRTLQGEELVISNTDIVSTRVQNYKKLLKRRVVLEIGVVYETEILLLRKVKEIIPELFSNIQDVEFQRVHLKSLGSHSLNFEIVYTVLSGDYVVFMDRQDEINFAILEAFAKNKIEFAYPTQLILNKSL